MLLKNIPFYNRPGYRLKKDRELNSAELLAIILERGNEFNESSIDLANKLLSKNKSLARIADLSLTELKKQVGEVKALKIKAMFEIFRETSRIERKGYEEPIAKSITEWFIYTFCPTPPFS